MTRHLMPIITESDKKTLHSSNITSTRKHYRHILKSKENVIKFKCSQVLKRRLKKYRLRKEGEEDKDVLEVSKTFQLTLQIKSPTKTPSPCCCEESPKNYLFKMGRRKHTIKEKPLETENVSSNEGILLENKKTADAFKLLMDGRNKSIGSNSPGKEKLDDFNESLNIIEKRNSKAKRLLVLQKMAEAKGSLKNKEKEEYEEQCIKRKLEKRAENFKSMFLKKETKSELKTYSKKSTVSEPTTQMKEDETTQVTPLNVKSLSLIDMFIEDESSQKSPTGRPISKEDEEFLNKLSPSIRKKENMLCYFKKIDKDRNSLDESGLEANDSLIIKVKLKPRTINKKRLSLKKTHKGSKELTETHLDTNDGKIHKHRHDKKIQQAVKNDNFDKDIEATNIPIEPKILHKYKDKQEQRKRKLISSKIVVTNTDDLEINERRPKRTVKKPVKYTDDVFLESSDDEVIDCTPKKKKLSEKDVIPQNKNSIKKKTLDNKIYKEFTETPLNIDKTSKKKVKDKHKKQSLKLAPIFAVKTQLINTEANEAKQKFLQSGVPEQLKKKKIQQENNNSPANEFVIVVHVQQIDKTGRDQIVSKETVELHYHDTVSDEDIGYPNIPFKCFINAAKTETKSRLPAHTENKTTVLQNMKVSYPKFPVFRTYQYLKSKFKGEFRDISFTELDNSVEIDKNLPDISVESVDRLMWSDKYRPLTAKQIIGNFETVRELKKWLETWTENDYRKSCSQKNSDSSDFCMSDTDSRDSVRSFRNLLILTGPVGSGKTSAVYAVAAELAIKVIEVNASSKRTGKIMLQDLQEATQSHKVNRGIGSQENSQKTQNVIEKNPVLPKKRGRKKKDSNFAQKEKENLSQEQTSSQETNRTCMSLILIDDADVVFDQDDGFCSAVAQLVHSSKRPVILITGSLSCSHLQKFVQSGRILKTNPFIPRMLGTWLDIMCLVDTGKCWPGLGTKLLDNFKGDIRKTINYLQFYTSTEVVSDNFDSQNSVSYKPQLDDENSNFSCINVDSNEDILETYRKSVEECKFICEEQGFIPSIFDYWWHIPKLFQTVEKCDENDKLNTEYSSKDFAAVADAIDSFSSIDYIGRKTVASVNITSDPWFTVESNSVVETENWENYDMANDINDEICQYIAKNSELELQGIFGNKLEVEIKGPHMSEQREKDRLVARHSTLTNFLNPAMSLDRKALALDYWSACRSICRVEKAKADIKTRRTNRFCHYLRTLNVLCNSESLDNLCESLNSFDNS